MLKYQKECDERLRFELNSEITRIREVEATAIKIEEASKYRNLLQKMRTEQEDYWKNQLEILKDREKEIKDRVFVREKEIEIREHRQRQQFEKELEILKIKENDLKRSVEIELEGAKLQRNSWEQKKLEVEAKLKELESFKASLSNKALEDFNHYKRQFEADFDDEKRRLYNEKFEIQALKDAVNQEYNKIKEAEDRLKEQGKELTETKKQLEYYRNEYEKTSKEIVRNKEELRLVSETSRRDLDLLVFKDQELNAIKNECAAYKELYSEQKEAIKKYEANQQMFMEKLVSEGNNKRNPADSEFLAERKAIWKQLDKESLDIKKNMIEMIAQTSYPVEHFKTNYRPNYRTTGNLNIKPGVSTLHQENIDKPSLQIIRENDKNAPKPFVGTSHTLTNTKKIEKYEDSEENYDESFEKNSESYEKHSESYEKHSESYEKPIKSYENPIKTNEKPQNTSENLLEASFNATKLKETKKLETENSFQNPITSLKKDPPIEIVFSEENSKEYKQDENPESSSQEDSFY